MVWRQIGRENIQQQKKKYCVKFESLAVKQNKLNTRAIFLNYNIHSIRYKTAHAAKYYKKICIVIYFHFNLGF